MFASVFPDQIKLIIRLRKHKLWFSFVFITLYTININSASSQVETSLNYVFCSNHDSLSFSTNSSAEWSFNDFRISSMSSIVVVRNYSKCIEFVHEVATIGSKEKGVLPVLNLEVDSVLAFRNAYQQVPMEF